MNESEMIGEKGIKHETIKWYNLEQCDFLIRFELQDFHVGDIRFCTVRLNGLKKEHLKSAFTGC